ncbi:hypothetical protein AAMO2058_000961800 [Amorphochlora amoebiformis]
MHRPRPPKASPALPQRPSVVSHRMVGDEVEFLVYRRDREMGEGVQWERAEGLPTQTPLRYFATRLEETSIDEHVGRRIQENRRLRSQLERVSHQLHRAQARCEALESSVRILEKEIASHRSPACTEVHTRNDEKNRGINGIEVRSTNDTSSHQRSRCSPPLWGSHWSEPNYIPKKRTFDAEQKIPVKRLKLISFPRRRAVSDVDIGSSKNLKALIRRLEHHAQPAIEYVPDSPTPFPTPGTPPQEINRSQPQTHAPSKVSGEVQEIDRGKRPTEPDRGQRPTATSTKFPSPPSTGLATGENGSGISSPKVEDKNRGGREGCPSCGERFKIKADVIQHLRSNLRCFFNAFRSQE